MTIDILKVLTVSILTFLIGIGITPIFTHFAYKYKWWKKKSFKDGALDGGSTPVFNSLRKDVETKTPRMGGMVIWVSVVITTAIVWLLSIVVDGEVVDKLNFVSRNQTWLPIFTLVMGAILGLFDDSFEIISSAHGNPKGLPRKVRVGIVLSIGLLGGLWFFYKLGVSAIYLPFIGNLFVGWLIVPIFIFFVIGMYSGGTIDGVDGLSGGVFGSMFAAYSIIAFFQNQIDLAAFSAAVLGGILAFLWFNIPPARFWMTDTGTTALTITITTIAFLTDSVVPLIVIALPLIATSATTILQYYSKKFRGGKKIFLATPIHHHFEAIGWPSYKVTMRYWVVSVMCAILGTVIALI